MDTNAQNQDKSQQIVAPSQPQNGQQPAGQISQPAGPMSGGQKERAPLPSPSVEVAKAVEVVPQAPEVPAELKELGVEAQSETPKIAEDVAKQVVPAKEATPVVSEPSGVVSLPQDDMHLPLTKTEAETTLSQNHNNTSVPMVWLANIVLRLLKKPKAHHVKGHDIIG